MGLPWVKRGRRDKLCSFMLSYLACSVFIYHRLRNTKCEASIALCIPVAPKIAILQKVQFPYQVSHALEKISHSAKRETSSRFSVDPSLCLRCSVPKCKDW